MDKKKAVVNTLQVLAGICISGAGIIIFFRKVSLSELESAFSDFSLSVIAAGCFFALFTLWLRSVRWRVILPDKEGTDTEGLYGEVSIGFMINNIVPFRIGEAVRIYLLWKRNRFSAAVSIGSVLLERVIDVVMFMFFFSVPVLILPKYSSLIGFAWMVLAIAAGVVGVLVFIHFFKNRSRGLLQWVLSLLPIKGERLELLLEDIISNLEWMDSPLRCLKVAVLSVLTSGSYAMIVFLLTLQIDAIAFLDSFVIMAFSSVGAAIPLAPGYVGTLHAVMKEGFVLAGAGESAAVAATVIYHAITYIPVTVAGAVFFWSMKIGISEIKKAEKLIDKRRDKNG